MISFLLERGKTREITVGKEGAGMPGPAYDALDELKWMDCVMTAILQNWG